jgi:cell division protease FtsH
MVTRYGMSSELGHVTYEQDHRTFLGSPAMEYHERRYSEATAREIDLVVKKLIDEAFARTTAILRGQRDLLDRCAHALLEKETLNEADLLELTGKGRLAAAQ